MNLIKNWFNRLLPKIFYNKLEDLKKYKDFHKGESCYIFGDGLSIKYFNLNNFSNYISIPVAFLPFHLDFRHLNVPYAFIIENSYFYPFNRSPIKPNKFIPNIIQREYHNFIKERKDIHFFLSITNCLTVLQNNVTFLHKYWIDQSLPNGHIGYDSERLRGSVNAALFLSIYMGFSKIYLVGFDYTHKPSRVLHWYEKGEGFYRVDMDDYNIEYFKLARQYADIITVTIDSDAYNLPSITYKELTGNDPKFRENTELLTSDKLKILSTWPGYTIY